MKRDKKYWTVFGLSVIVTLFLIASGCDGGNENASTTTEGTLPGKYLLAFHACNTAVLPCSNPSDHTTYIAYSDNGTSWAPLPDFTPFQGSVPDIIRRNDTLYIYTPGKVIRYTISTKTQDNGTSVTMTTPTGSSESFVDPSPYLDPSTNKIVLFYLSNTGSVGDPAQCTTCPMRSATEVDGSNGSRFVVDSGDRAMVSGGQVTDPDIFYDGTKYVLYISRGPSVLVFTSPSLQGTYTPVSTLTNGLLTSVGGVPAGHYNATTGEYWTYVHASNPSVIKRATHSDFSRQLTSADFSTVLSGASFSTLGASYLVQSPGFLVNP